MARQLSFPYNAMQRDPRDGRLVTSYDPYYGLKHPLARAQEQLTKSRAYLQADKSGRERMKKLVGMGLPANTDIQRVRAEGRDPMTGRTIYSAPMQQPWGTWGGFGEEEKERPVRIPKRPNLPQKPTASGPLSSTSFRERVRNEFPPTLAGGITQWFDPKIPRFPYSGMY